jgi:predicted Zn finger-like uncharacterized protein
MTAFQCQNCQAQYRLVRAESGPETRDRQITCRQCGASFPSRQGNLIFKYFRVDKPRTDAEVRA